LKYNSQKKLSILIPVKNEIPYIYELLNELVPLNRADTEIIISDNYSDDGTWEYIQKYKDKVFVTRPDKPCSPFENHLNALRHAKGEYVFPMGGDDIITKSAISDVIPYLEDNKIVIGQMQCFEDKTRSLLSLTNTANDILGFFPNKTFSLYKYFKFINYDQLIFSFVPRDNQQFLFKLKPNTVEAFASWSNIFNFFLKTTKDITLIQKTVFFKRYNKSGQNSFAEDQKYSSTTHLQKSFNSILNSLLFFSTTGSIIGVLQCLLMNRTAKGHYDVENKNILINKFISFGPLIMVFLSPFIKIYKISKKLILYKRSD